MNRIKLAIVIPYFKSKFFKETLDSLNEQSCQKFNIYIGDDASPEDPEPIINQYPFLNITYQRFEKNFGSSSLTGQWERCLQMVSGEEWLMLLCDDDLLSEKCIESFYDNYNDIIRANSKVIRFASVEIDENSNRISREYRHPVLESSSDSYFKKLFKGSRSSLSEYIFRRTSFLEYGFKDYPLAWGADNRAWLDFSQGQPIYTINAAIVFFRLSGSNISRKNFMEDLKWKARRLFFVGLFEDHLDKFTSEQKIKLSLYFEWLLKITGEGSLLERWYIFKILIQNGKVWESIKFIRRIYLSTK